MVIVSWFLLGLLVMLMRYGHRSPIAKMLFQSNEHSSKMKQLTNEETTRLASTTSAGNVDLYTVVTRKDPGGLLGTPPAYSLCAARYAPGGMSPETRTRPDPSRLVYARANEQRSYLRRTKPYTTYIPLESSESGAQLYNSAVRASSGGMNVGARI